MSHRPQAKCRRIELSLKTKIDLIRAAESVPKLNQNQLPEKFGISTSISIWYFEEKRGILCGIWKEREQWNNEM